MSQSMINEALGSPTTLWNLTGQLNGVNSSAIGSITTAALAVGGMLYIFQVSSIVWESFKQGGGVGGNILNKMLYLLLQLAAISALLKSNAYKELYGLVVGLPAQTIAEHLTLIYWDGFIDAWGKILEPPKQGTAGNLWSFFKTAIAGADAMLTTVVATIIMIVVTVIVFLIPLVQGKLFLYLFYIGPFALMFTICDYTRKIFHNWLGLSLSVAWTGVFGSIALLLCTSGGVFDKIQAGDAGFNWITTAVYGVIAIVLLCSSFFIAQYMFGAMGSGLQSMMSPGRQISGAAGAISGGIVGGAAVAGAGGAIMSKIGGGGGHGSETSSDSGKSSGGASSSGGSSSGESSSGSDSSGGASGASVPRGMLQRVGDSVNKASHAVLKAGGSNGHTAEKIVGGIESAINYKQPKQPNAGGGDSA